MLIRTIFLFLAFAGTILLYMQCFHRIDRSHYALVGRTVLKLTVAAGFSAAIIAACGILSYLTN